MHPLKMLYKNIFRFNMLCISSTNQILSNQFTFVILLLKFNEPQYFII